MKEFLRKVKKRIKLFDYEHNRILSRYKIFIIIMSVAIFITVTGLLVGGAVMVVHKNQEKANATKMPLRTRWPEEAMTDAEVETQKPTKLPTASPIPIKTPLPVRTPVPSVTPTPTPDAIVNDIEKPEDVQINETIMTDEDKKEDVGNKPSNKVDGNNGGNNGGGSSSGTIIPEANKAFLTGARRHSYLAANFLTKNGRKYYVEDGAIKSRIGIDVSVYQGDINWQKVKASGVDFVIIRLGFRGYVSGKLVLDSNFIKNIEGALAADLDVGVYFFSQAITTREAVEEAKMCLKYLAPYKNKITYPVAIDTEFVNSSTARTNRRNVTNKVRTDVCIAFCETVKNAGYKPMVYSNENWLLNNIQLSRLNNYDIWYARYGAKTLTYPYDFEIWQFTGSGKVDGISVAVDINIGLKDYSGSGQADNPSKTQPPQESEEPKESELPKESQVPQESIVPTESQTPIGSETPQESEAPTQSEVPIESEVPQESEEPLESESPEGGDDLEGEDEPQLSPTPSPTQEPSNTQEPLESESPSESEEPQKTDEPQAPEGPQLSYAPSKSPSPENY